MSLTSMMWIGASGIDAASTDLEEVGNNLANADTVGYKESRADFETQISQNLLGAGQVGLGTALQMSQQIMTQGSLQTTGNATDLALQGNGFFLVQGDANGQTGQYYTRDGQFSVNNQGLLVTQGGLDVQGYTANATGQLTSNIGNLQVGDSTSPPNPTANVTVQANLDSTAATPAGAWDINNAGTTSNFSTSTTVYDSLGNPYQVQIYFRNDGGGQWEWHAVTDGGGLTGGVAGAPTQIANGTMNFSATGALTSETQASDFNPLNATDPQALNFNFGTPTGSGGSGTDGITQYAETSATTFVNQDGYASGTLSNIAVDSSGNVTGTYTNGQSLLIGQVAVATFAAPDQLTEDGGNLYSASYASGQATVGTAGTGGRASIASGSLEQSNVNMSDELVEMIAAQRNFQANSKIISAADGVLQDLMNISASNT